MLSEYTCFLLNDVLFWVQLPGSFGEPPLVLPGMLNVGTVV